MKRMLCALLVFSLAITHVFCQDRDETRSEPASFDRAAEADERLRLAISSMDYPVTPGDQYRLTYRQTSDTLITRDVLVEADSHIDFGIFGKVSAYGLDFVELKQEVEALIQSGYTRSMPNLSIVAPGIFRISVRGEISQTRYVTVWGLSRLSDVVFPVKESYTSIRDVAVVSADGEERHYDLLRALRQGMNDQNPYVRPGDVIMLSRAGRTVRITGEIRQPGEYELLGDEGIKQLIEDFGHGLTSRANAERLRIDRETASGGRTEYVSLKRAYEEGVSLADGDTIIVTTRSGKRPIVWLMGAVTPPQGGPDTENPGQDAGSLMPSGEPQAGQGNRFPYSVLEGELLSDVLAEINGSILSVADLSALTIYRQGAKPMFIDAARLLSGDDSISDIILMANDIIYIPEIRSTVNVAGAVLAPGGYPFRPGAPASYYISLAGGFDPERSTDGQCRVYSPTGKVRKAEDGILAGDQVYVTSNSFSYQFERNAPLLVTIAGVLVNITTLYFMFLNNQ